MFALQATPPPLAGMITPQSQQRMFGSTNTQERDTPEVIREIPKQPTSLKLSPERLTWLMQRIHDRIGEVKTEMGLGTDGNTRPNSWMDVRLRNEATYENDLTWREAIGPIFRSSNFTLGTNKRYARLAAARYRQDLLGTRPYFGAFTTSNGDPNLTKSAETFIQERLDTSNVGEALREAQKVAVVRNEAVVKTIYLREESGYIGPAKVLVGPDGLPLYTPAKNLLIYEKDDFIPDPTAEGFWRLQKDPSFQCMQGQFQYADFDALPQRLVHYDNVDSEVLDVRDFLCPLMRRSVHEADINVHIYSQTPEALISKWGSFATSQDYINARPQSGSRQPRTTHAETEHDGTLVNNYVTAAEAFIRVDADGDGKEEEVWVVFDLLGGVKPDAVLFYDYLGNHMKRRPFGVIPGIERVARRWYGVGVFTMMEHPGLYIDTQFNRYNFKDSNSASCTFRVPSAVKEWKARTPTELGTHKIYDVEPGYDSKNPPIFRANLAEDSEHGRDLMMLMQQAGDLQFGAISAQDASASDLNQSKTATGIISIERSSNTLTQDTEHEHVIGIEQILEQAVDLLLENMDPTELMFTKEQVLLELNKEEIRALPKKVKLLLTRTRSAEQLVTNEKAEAVALRYMRLSVPEQFHLRPLYVGQLKGLEVNDADHLLPEVTQDQFKAWQEAQAAAAKQGPPKEDKEPSVSISYKDAPPSIQRQMEEDAGYQPAPPEEIAEMEAKEAEEKKAELDAKAKASEKKPNVSRPK